MALLNNYLEELQQYAPVVYLKDYLCNDRSCEIAINNTPLYADTVGHMTSVGAAEFGKKIDFFRIIENAVTKFDIKNFEASYGVKER